MTRAPSSISLSLLVALAMAMPIVAQETAAPVAGFALELNALQPADAGCRVTFLASNTLGTVLDRAAVEVALFDTAGVIDRIVTLDFKGLEHGKTKVLQFELAGLACDQLGRVLVNDITACEGDGLVPATCLSGLVTTTRPDVTFGV